MTEYTIDDIRGPTVAREMAQLKEFVLAQFNGAIADAEAAAAAAATAAANAVLANTVKKTGEASQSIAGDIAVTGALDAASIGSGSTPVVCGNLTAYGSVSLDDTTLQGNLSGADASALINLSGVGSVLVPTPTSNGEAATKKYVDDALDNYAPMVRTTGNQGPIAGVKQFAKPPALAFHESGSGNTDGWRKIFVSPTFAVNNEYNICSFELITSKGSYGLFTAIGRNGSLYNIVKRVGNFSISNIKMSIDSDGEVIIWVYDYRTVGKMNLEVHAGSNSVTFTDSGTTSIFSEPTTPDYVQVLTCTE